MRQFHTNSKSNFCTKYPTEVKLLDQSAVWIHGYRRSKISFSDSENGFLRFPAHDILHEAFPFFDDEHNSLHEHYLKGQHLSLSNLVFCWLILSQTFLSLLNQHTNKLGQLSNTELQWKFHLNYKLVYIFANSYLRLPLCALLNKYCRYLRRKRTAV